MLPERVPDLASMDSSFLQLFICLCILTFQESLFLIYFHFFARFSNCFRNDLLQRVSRWFISILSVSFSFSSSSSIPFPSFFLKVY